MALQAREQQRKHKLASAELEVLVEETNKKLEAEMCCLQPKMLCGMQLAKVNYMAPFSSGFYVVFFISSNKLRMA